MPTDREPSEREYLEGLMEEERDRIAAGEDRVVELQNDIEGIISLAYDVLGVLQPWPVGPFRGDQSPAMKSAVARLTVALAAYPLPSPVASEKKPCASCDVLDGHDPDCPSLLF